MTDISKEELLQRSKAERLRARNESRRDDSGDPTAHAHCWIVFVAFASLPLLLIGIVGIAPDNGPVAMLRNLAMAALGAALVYGVGKFSIEIGAKRAAEGDRAMLALCLSAFLATGLIIAPTTYFAMAKKVVAEMVINDHGQRVKAASEAANRTIVESQGLRAPVAQGYSEVSETQSCERLRGCLTGKPYSGKGPAPVSDFLGEAAARLVGGLQALEDAENRREALVRELDRAGDAFSALAADRSINAEDKRSELITLDSAIRDSLAQLEQVSPVPALQNLARDLRDAGGALTGTRRNGMDQARTIVRKHGVALERALGEIDSELVPLPPFPAPVTLSSGFDGAVLKNTLPYLFLAIFIECSGIFCFLLCMKYHRGRLLDQLDLLEMEAREKSRKSPSSGQTGRRSRPGPHPDAER